MDRRDFAFPFRIDAASGQAAQAPYAAHVRQMIRQILLTAPGERVNLPEFGCGLRQLLFAPHSEALDASVKIIVLQSLERWLGDQVEVREVRVTPGDGGAELRIQIEYSLVDTRSGERIEVQVN